MIVAFVKGNACVELTRRNGTVKKKGNALDWTLPFTKTVATEGSVAHSVVSADSSADASVLSSASDSGDSSSVSTASSATGGSGTASP